MIQTFKHAVLRWNKRREYEHLVAFCHDLQEQVESGNANLQYYSARRDRAGRELLLLEHPRDLVQVQEGT